MILNPQQSAAVVESGHCVVVACPGSGKTRVLVEKAQRLLEQDPKARIVIVTFTRASAKELRDRLAASSPDQQGRALASTFHSLALRQLLDAGAFSRVLDPGQQDSLLRRAWSEHCKDTKYAAFIDLIERRSRGHCLADVSNEAGVALDHYLSLLEQHRAVDFGEAMVRCVDLLRTGGVKPIHCTHLLVDEFQDVDAVQLNWVLEHTKAGAILTAVGDDDQSVYGWRGSLGYNAVAYTRKALNARILPLEVNYRSHSEILGLSSRLIRNNTRRVDKGLVSALGAGGSTRFSQYETLDEEIETMCEHIRPNPGEWAVISRSNFKLDPVEAAFKRANIPYHRPGGESFWDSPGPSLLLSVLDALVGPPRMGAEAALAHAGVPESDLPHILNDHGVVRTLPTDLHPLNRKRATSLAQTLARATGAPPSDAITSLAAWLCTNSPPESKIIPGIQAGAKALRSFDGSLQTRLMAARRPPTPKEQKGCRLVTMHSSKGLEFPSVWLPGLIEGTMPNRRSADIEEERRLLYVAFTRAERRLVLSLPWTHTYETEEGEKRTVKNKASRFLISDLSLPMVKSTEATSST